MFTQSPKNRRFWYKTDSFCFSVLPESTSWIMLVAPIFWTWMDHVGGTICWNPHHGSWNPESLDTFPRSFPTGSLRENPQKTFPPDPAAACQYAVETSGPGWSLSWHISKNLGVYGKQWYLWINSGLAYGHPYIQTVPIGSVWSLPAHDWSFSLERCYSGSRMSTPIGS